MAARDPGDEKEYSTGEVEHEDSQTTEPGKRNKTAWARIKHRHPVHLVTGYKKKVSPGPDTPPKREPDKEMWRKKDKPSRKSSPKRGQPPPAAEHEEVFVKTGVPGPVHPLATAGAAPAHQTSSTHKQTRVAESSLTYDHLVQPAEQVGLVHYNHTHPFVKSSSVSFVLVLALSHPGQLHISPGF